MQAEVGQDRDDRDRPASPRIDAPSRSDGFVGGLAELIGGRLGEHAPVARRSVKFVSLIVLALTCLTLALHFVQKSPCRDGAWTDYKQYTNFCYTDVLALYYAEGLSDGQVPYVDHAVEYPVLTGVMMGVIGLPVHAYGQTHPDFNQGQAFYDITALVLFLFALGTVAMMLAIRRTRPWDVAMFALSPALLVTATVNWDFLAIVLAVGGLYAWSRKWPGYWAPALTGVLLGLGTAAKLWPGFLFVGLLALALRTWRWAPLFVAAGTAVTTWLAVNVPVMVLNFDNWRRFIDLNNERGVDWGVLYYIGRYVDAKFWSGGEGDSGLFQWLSRDENRSLLNGISLALFAVACLGIIYLAMRAPVPPRLTQLAFLTVAAFLLFNKVWSQQFTLWLLPLAILARPRWGAFLAWQVAEVAYFLTFYGELLGASGKSVMPEGVFIFASIARWVTVAVLCGLVIREIRNPRLDVVRQSDPLTV
ncbi:MAG: hypothetical protein HOV71_02200 [Hamadaea sp.]|nr:hypothetical protein [Hamadaea sp.]NUR46925.1 hypothetical protein [Hamadaea sp.]NUT07527.1 hypothetical protein [Hamadaea sp.]